MIFLLGRVVQNTLKEEENRIRKTLKMNRKKNEEYKESQITTTSIFGFIFYRKNDIFLENIV